MTFRRVAGDLSGRRTPVEGLAHRPLGSVRQPGCSPVCRLGDSGLLPFDDDLRLAALTAVRQHRRQVREAVFVDSGVAHFGLARAISGSGVVFGVGALNSLTRQAASRGSQCPDG
ncbi:hypothetical protein I553_8836 [Mycobacterium xenopi 4042]|uniref:Uncharacterized protein n=1 Tax=Mycobacterium xenopi 4042 TaxID=1299334 RepID=X8CKA8_MYCXE|nr:hypothetical protein I553_8836 [Mycobacterium xenopi 4042]